MPDELRLDYRTSGPVFSKREELVVWAKDDGTLHTTDQDGTDSPVGGGGGTVVSCVLARDSTMNVETSGGHNILWDALYDNMVDFNALTEIPEGLGLSFAFDGSSEVITAAETGTWALTLSLSRAATDTWEGSYRDVGLSIQFDLPPCPTVDGSTPDPGNSIISYCVTVPTGSTFKPQIVTVRPTFPTDYFFNGTYLSIVRLG